MDTLRTSAILKGWTWALATAVVFLIGVSAVAMAGVAERENVGAAEAITPSPLSPTSAAMYDGRYVAGTLEYFVSHEGNQVFVSFNGNARVQLVPAGVDQFHYAGVRATLRFVRGADGNIASLYQNFAGINIPAARTNVPPPETASYPLLAPGSGPPRTEPRYPYHKPIEAAYRDVAYANASPAEKLDLYLPVATNHLCPLVIWIHGGAFMVGDKRSMPRREFGPPPTPIAPMGPFQIQVPDAAALTEKGYAVASLNYRLLMRPGEPFRVYATAAVEDAKAAVRFLRAHAAEYHLNPDKFAVWGNSAGGYMAAMLGVTGDQASRFDALKLGNPFVSSKVQAVVVWYGAIDDDSLLPAVRFPHYLATAKVVPPFLIAHGDADRSVSVVHARRFDQLLRKRGVDSTLTILRGAGHEDPAFMATQMEPTFRFLDGVFGGAGAKAREQPRL